MQGFEILVSTDDPKTGSVSVYNIKLGRFETNHTVDARHSYSHFYSWKLGPGFVILSTICVILNLRGGSVRLTSLY
jgi:hypothetical protein